MPDHPTPLPPNLDPEDWEAFRNFAHELVDAMVDRHRDMAAGPVWRPVPEDVKARIGATAPAAPTPYDEIRRDLDELVLPFSVGNTHPRFWGWVHGSGTPGGALAEFVAAMLNANCGGRDHSAIYLERAVIGYARDWFGFPEYAGGLLVSGSSMANLLGLAAARQRCAGPGLRENGIAGKPLTAYASAQAHSSLVKAMEVLGLGREALRKIPVDTEYRMDVAALEARIGADRASGNIPFAVVATAGTVNTGAFDDLDSIADLCVCENLWLHVDGAFGALVKLAPELATLADGVERADSIAFDFHKWLHVPYDAGCILVRDAKVLPEAFGGRPDYLASAGGLAGGEPWPSDLGIELSRGARALKVWWTIKEQGLDRLGAAIARNCAQAKYLAARLSARENIEIAAPIPLNIVCCRYVAPGLDGLALDALNVAIVVELQESGLAAPSTTKLEGRTCIRVCITNHRSRDGDFDLLTEAIAKIGARLAVEALR
jgi:aromatic-L-amino-acid/L-tryptophan decarboxylase